MASDWRITPDERSKHDAQFFQLGPVNGCITGEQAKGFFLKSSLPPAVLGQIWGLSDLDNDGKMNKKEFSIACYLITKKLRGIELPKALPDSMKLDPAIGGQPSAAPLSMPTQMPTPIPVPMPTMLPNNMASTAFQPNIPVASGMMPGMMPSGMGMGMPTTMSPMGMTPSSSFPSLGAVPLNGTTGMLNNLNRSRAGSLVDKQQQQQPSSAAMMLGLSFNQSPPGPPADAWAVPQASQARYRAMFATQAGNMNAFMTGQQAQGILSQSGLPRPALAGVWALSDVDQDGKLSCDEFILTMHLCDVVRMGQALPNVLPPELVPVSMRKPRAGSMKDSFGDLLSGTEFKSTENKVDAAAEQAAAAAAAAARAVTFEDKRKENFDKGQMELERRRQALREIEERERRDREEKERAEQEKREKIRQEQERRKQQEMERVLAKQREIEMAKEEERRKAVEQRESAQREMERQRRLEWERQRKQELEMQKNRAHERLTQLEEKDKHLEYDLQSMDEKMSQVKTKIAEARMNITTATESIDQMRQLRDQKIGGMEQMQMQIHQTNARLNLILQERQRIEAQIPSHMLHDSPFSEQLSSFMQQKTMKQSTVSRLQAQWEEIQQEVSKKMGQFEVNKGELLVLKEEEAGVKEKNKEMYNDAKDKWDEWQQAKMKKPSEVSSLQSISSTTESNAILGSASASETNFEAFTTNNGFDDAGWSASTPAETVQPQHYTNIPSQDDGGKVKHRAVYPFDAREHDELSIQPGDIVMVDMQRNAGEGWFYGECMGRCGIFPAAYAPRCDDQAQSDDTLKAETTLEPKRLSDIPETPEIQIEATPDNGHDEPPATNGSSEVRGLIVEAFSAWTGKKENHLPLQKGDLITVREEKDAWYSGDLNGRAGWFPKSYVKPYAPAVIVQSVDQPVNQDTKETGDASSVGDLSSGSSTISGGTSGESEQYVALFAYASGEQGDLAFNQGDAMIVTKKDGDWWTGLIGSRTGMFPSNYVKKVENQVPNKKTQEVASVIAAYTATSAEQLSLTPGQLIRIRKKSDTGWWQGELLAKGKKRQIGWFPANYVKLLASSSSNRNTPDMRPVSPWGSGSAAGAADQNKSRSITPLATPTSPRTNDDVEKVVALYDFQASSADELSFSKDAVITVIGKEEGGWWRGESGGATGMFPSNYVQPVDQQRNS